MERFRLDGQELELTQDIVRQRISLHHPESVQQYWGEIDEVRWPVKQVMPRATGLDRRRFQSQNSRRLLAKLGFAVGMGSTALAPACAATSHPRNRTQFDVSAVPEFETPEVDVHLVWRRAGEVVLDEAGFPQGPWLPRDPGLYRFDFGLGADDVRTLYVGESKSLSRRAGTYRNAKIDRSTRRTSRRIHMEIVEHLASGGSIELGIVTEVLSSGKAIDLRRTAGRRFAENAAVFMAQTTSSTRVLDVEADIETEDAE